MRSSFKISKVLYVYPCPLKASRRRLVNLHFGSSGVPLMKAKKGNLETISSMSRKAFSFSSSKYF